MALRLTLHPATPQARYLQQAADCLRKGGIIVMPTDTCLALTAMPGQKAAMERIARIKMFQSDKKLFSLIVPDLADVARYAKVDNQAYRILRRCLPGAYTFVLSATREVPRMLLSKRKTIGLRVPKHEVAQRVAELAGGALLATTLSLPEDDGPLTDLDEVEERVGSRVDLILDQGRGGSEPSSLVDLSGDEPVVLRVGAGDIDDVV